MKRKGTWKKRLFAFLLAFTVICTNGNATFYSFAEESVEALEEEKKEAAPKEEEKKEEAPKEEEKKEEAPKEEEKKEEAPKEEEKKEAAPKEEEKKEEAPKEEEKKEEAPKEEEKKEEAPGEEGSGEEGDDKGAEGGESGTDESEETEELETEELETEELETEELETEETEEAQVDEYRYEDDRIAVTATLSDAAAIPDEAEFVVDRIGEGSSRYKELEELAARQIGEGKEVKNILAYDMRFELEGEEIEPAEGTVSVAVNYKEKEQLLLAEELANEEKSGEAKIETGILHIKDGDEVEKLSGSVNMDGEGKVESAGFETDSFSEIVMFGASAPTISGKTDATYEGSFKLEYILNNFNIFVKDELVSKNHIVGEIMAGGDAQIAELGGDYESGPDKTRVYRWKVPGYVKGKAAVPGDESSLGKPLYKGLENMPANPTSQIYTDDYMSFGKAFSSIDSQCSTLLADSSAIRVKKGDSLKLTEGSNYIIEAGAWKDAITICSSTGETSSLKGLPTVITVEGEGEFSFSGIGYGVKNNDWYNKTPINAVVVFPNATKVNLQTGGNAVGHLVAPKAKVSITMGGNYNGSIVAKSLSSTSNTEFHKRHWSGDIKTDKKTISISGKKTWVNLPEELNDTNAAYWNTVRVVVGLYANGQKQEEVTISKWTTKPAAWSYQFSNLPEKDSAGKNITYTVKEEDIYNYNGKDNNDKITDYWVSYNGYNIINTYGEKPETVTVSGTKTWEGDTEAVRPASIKVVLYEGAGADKKKVTKDADAQTITNPVTVSSTNNWEYEFTNLPKKAADGNVYAYSVEEENVPDGYAVSYAANTYNITNTYKEEKTEVKVKKEWVDKTAGAAIPKELKATLYKSTGAGTKAEVDSVMLTAEKGWEHTFTELPVKENGKDITYTVEETVPDGWKASQTTAAVASGKEIKLTNAYVGETTIKVAKVWEDNDNAAQVRPENIQVTLWKSAGSAGAQKEAVETVTLQGDAWEYDFGKLPAYTEEGSVITYSVEEADVTGYWKQLPDEWVAMAGQSHTFTIRNTYGEETIKLSGKKTWNDNGDEYGNRPGEITLEVLRWDAAANGGAGAWVKTSLEETVKPDAAGNWAYEITVNKYDANKQENRYKVVEKNVPGYTPSYDGNDRDIANTPTLVSVSVEKFWSDNEDAYGLRPDSIEVRLVADGDSGNPLETYTLKKEEGWKHTFTNLPEYRNGQRIFYSVEEVAVTDGYEVSSRIESSTTSDIIDVYLTNTLITIDPYITKIWQNDNSGVRPSSIQVTLYKGVGGERTQVGAPITIQPDGNGNWRYEFKNLPKYEKDATGQIVEIVYSITETPIANYSASVVKRVSGGEEFWQLTNTYEEDEDEEEDEGGGGRRRRRSGGGGTTTIINDQPVALSGEVLGADRTMQEYALPQGEVLGSTRTPQTGDEARPWVWGILLLFSTTFLVAGYVLERKKKK